MSSHGSYGPANVVFTDALAYGKKPDAAQGKIKRQNVPSYNKNSFVPGDTMLFTIPTRRPNQLLNGRQSFLKFTLVNPDANTLAVDYTADSIIESLELFHGSQLIEQIRSYNALVCFVKDFQGNKNIQAMMEGEHQSTPRTGATVAANGGTLSVCIPILSGVIGSMQPKFFPAYALTTGDLRLELTLASAAAGVVNDTAVSAWTVSSPELILEYVEMSPAAIAKLPKSMDFAFESFENVSATIPSGTANEFTMIPFSLSSIKSLYSIYRFTSNMTSATAKTVSNRPNPQLAEWQYEIGGEQYPPTSVKSTVETFAEVLKAQHGLGVVDELVHVTKAEFELATAAATDAAFVLAQDLEWLTNAGSRAKSGVDARGIDIFLNQKWASPTNQAYRLDTFAHYDGTLVIADGQATVMK